VNWSVPLSLLQYASCNKEQGVNQKGFAVWGPIAGWSYWGRATSPLHQQMGLGEWCKLPRLGQRQRALATQQYSCILRSQSRLLNCYIVMSSPPYRIRGGALSNAANVVCPSDCPSVCAMLYRSRMVHFVAMANGYYRTIVKMEVKLTGQCDRIATWGSKGR